MVNKDSFFNEQAVVIEIQNGEQLRFYMRPLKVREIGLTCRVAEMQQSGASEAEYLPYLIKLVEGTVDIDIDGFPLTILDKIIEVFLNFNFPEDKKPGATKTKKKGREVPAPSKLAIAFDFLINQGHNFSDILEYTLPQVQLFQQVAVERLTGVKRVDPVAALTGAGVVLKR